AARDAGRDDLSSSPTLCCDALSRDARRWLRLLGQTHLAHDVLRSRQRAAAVATRAPRPLDRRSGARQGGAILLYARLRRTLGGPAGGALIALQAHLARAHRLRAGSSVLSILRRLLTGQER